MAFKTYKQFLESLRDDRVVYFHGERVKDVTTHPMLQLTLNSLALDFLILEDPEYAKYRSIVVQENEKGEEIRFLTQQEKGPQDLLRRKEIVETMGRIGRGGALGGTSTTGKDALNALTIVCNRMDRLTGSTYGERLELYRQHMQKNDPAVVGAITDVKGNRGLHPSKQIQHQDFYVRVVDRQKDGIIVRGAKGHITYAPSVNEMLILPSRRHREEDKDYALAFAIPVNAKGITMVSSDPENMETDNEFDFPYTGSYYSNDAWIFFDDVFVPYERVFMDGEWQFSGDMAYAFGNSHRLFADSYKCLHLEQVVGAAMSMAEYNGTERYSHIQDKLAWLTIYCETVKGLAELACLKAVQEPGSDLFFPNPMYSNACKFYFADNFHQAIKHVLDISGGIVATLPSSKDFFNPETRPLIEKYLAGKAGIPTEERMRAIRAIREIVNTFHQVVTIHGEGSLAAQRLSINALADSKKYKAAFRRLARITVEDEHPLFKDLPDYPPKKG
jgi:4-hydroxybutyryl-CoA dehydratase / vinylacetyl-CoA-Delta-isomerase